MPGNKQPHNTQNMTEEKRSFLQNELPGLINNIKGNEAAKWGKMNVQQMIEHTSAFFKVSTQEIHFPLSTPAEHLPKYKEFLLSDKQFRENTKAAMLPEEPLPLEYASLDEARIDLINSINTFFELFKDDPTKTTLHPAFGELNFDEWVQLHHKHVMHHLRQFGLL